MNEFVSGMFFGRLGSRSLLIGRWVVESRSELSGRGPLCLQQGCGCSPESLGCFLVGSRHVMVSRILHSQSRWGCTDVGHRRELFEQFLAFANGREG